MNSGYTDTQGAELHFKYIGIHDWSADLQYGYAEQTGQLLKNTESYYPDLKIAGLVPRHSYSLLLIKNLPQHMQISLSHYFNDAMDWFSGSSMGAVKRTDIKLAKTFRSRSTEGKVSLVVQNLGDDYYEYEAQKNSTHRPNLFTTRAYLQVEYSI
jgi:hypothetical protein